MKQIPSEHAEQVALFQWARLAAATYPELRLLHAIPNGGARHITVARQLKLEGVVAGVPDICLPVSRRGYHGLYLELKRRRGAGISNAQDAWIRALREQGYNAVWVRGWDAARDIIQFYLDGAPT